jgi:hypothetical protein
MGLIVAPGPKANNRKVCLHEVRKEGTTMVPTGRRLYVDRDAPLLHIPGWMAAQRDGEGTVSSIIFNEFLSRSIHNTYVFP